MVSSAYYWKCDVNESIKIHYIFKSYSKFITYTGAYSEPSQTSKMELFEEKVNTFDWF